ncbi:MAG: DUF3108 domain-containing protein [Bacteroidetes bacterium]|nr:MAG: DUF3108 domain-containing protein [Bacteroidota bacterium]
MKKTILFLAYLIFSSSIIAQTDSVPIVNTAFKPDEYLKYKVKYGIINGGHAEMKIMLEQIGSDWYYHVKAIAATSGLVGTFASVNDRYESYIQLFDGLPLQSIRDINENNYRRYNEVIFDRDENKVISLKSGEHKVPPGTLDVLSAFYFARRMIFKKKFQKNQTINLTTYFDEQLYTVKVKYKKTEKIRTKFGKIKCLKFVPVIDEKSTVKKENDMQVWFSDDGNFIPVKIRLKVGISTVKCDLIQYDGLKNPLGKPFNH